MIGSIKEEAGFVRDFNDNGNIETFGFDTETMDAQTVEDWDELTKRLSMKGYDVSHDGKPDKWPARINVACGHVYCGQKLCTVSSEALNAELEMVIA